MNVKWQRALAGLAVAAAAAGCGSSSKPAASSAAGAATTTASSTATTASAQSSAAATTVATTAAAAKKITLAGIFENLQDPFWTSVTCGAQEAATKLGADLKLFTATGIDANKTASNFQTALLDKPAGVLASPFNTNGFVADFQKLMKGGVPVIVSAPTDPRSEYQSVFSDTNTAGFAKDAAALIPSGAGTMIVLGGAPGIPPLEARTKPFIDAIKAARTDLKALDTEYSGFDPNKSATDLGSTILANPDLKLVIVTNGPDGIGAANAIEKANLAGKVAVIAFDAIPPEVESLKKGTIQALIAQNPMEVGRQQVQAAVDYLKKGSTGEVPTTAAPVGIPQKLLTAKTVDDPANADFVYKPKC